MELIKKIAYAALTILIFYFVLADYGTYGKTEQKISYVTDETNPIGSDFSKLLSADWSEDVKVVPHPAGPGDKNLLVIDKSVDLPITLFVEGKGKLHSIEYLSYELSKGEAREMMSDLSHFLSDQYTDGKGIRRYKKSRNYVYNKEQNIMMEIRMERDGRRDYRVHVFVLPYSFHTRIKRYLYWRLLAVERPGLNILGFFVAL